MGNKRTAKRMVDLGITEVSGVDLPAHLEPGWAVMKAADPTVAADAQALLAALVADRYKENGESVTDIAVDKAAPDADAPDDDDEVIKSMPESVRKRLEDSEARAAEAMAKAARLEEASETREFVAKAATFTNLPIKAEDFGPLLRRVAKGATTPADAVELDRVLAAAQEAARLGGLQEVGKSGSGVGGEGVWPRIEAVAKQLVADGKAPSVAAGVDMALRADPELERAYVESRGI